ncbi:MAG: hypothetical protein KBC42_00415 [Candidatus Pacebacteria bacterium]|nr:hypothetical protein [Candidatus Paceibacterota bacterium]MBP9780370.1 hypothetical protein [Candidatus Paceibacterota bacterium]
MAKDKIRVIIFAVTVILIILFWGKIAVFILILSFPTPYILAFPFLALIGIGLYFIFNK